MYIVMYVHVHSDVCTCTVMYDSVLQSFAAAQLLFSRVHAVVDHVHEHVNIPEYTEHFRTYTDLGNQGATNAG